MLDGLTWRYRLNEARALLDREYLLLRKGALAELARLDGRRAAVEANILKLPEDVARAHEALIADIRARAVRNQRVLDAFIRGARQAAARIRAIEAETRDIGLYTESGARVAAGADRSTRRAKA